VPDSSERGETGGKSATRISKFRKLPTSNRRPFHTLRESRSSRLSRATSRRTVMNNVGIAQQKQLTVGGVSSRVSTRMLKKSASIRRPLFGSSGLSRLFG